MQWSPLLWEENFRANLSQPWHSVVTATSMCINRIFSHCVNGNQTGSRGLCRIWGHLHVKVEEQDFLNNVLSLRTSAQCQLDTKTILETSDWQSYILNVGTNVHFSKLGQIHFRILKKKKRRSKQQYYKSDQVFEACSRYNFSTLAHFSWYQFVLILDSQPRTTCDPPPVSDLSLSAAYCLHNAVIHIVVWYFYCAIDVYFFIVVFVYHVKPVVFFFDT